MIPGVLVLAIAAGVVWADAGRGLPDWLVLAWLVLAVILAGALLRKLRRGSSHWIPCAASLVCAVGLSGFTGFDRLTAELSRAHRDAERARAADREAVRLVEARVRSRRSGQWGDEIGLVSVRAVDGGGALPEQLLLRVDAAADASEPSKRSRADRLLWPGARVRLGLRILALHPLRNPGTRDREHASARRGTAARARLVKPDWVLGLSRRPREWNHLVDRGRDARTRLRQRVGARLALAGSSAGLVRALGLGDRRGLRMQTRQAFRAVGLSHLLAISGLHVGFVAILAGWLCLRIPLRASRWGTRPLPFDWALGIACGAAALYAWITGAGISVERAALLFGLYAVSRLCLRSVAPGVALAWVAAAILVIDPAALFDPGAQLSFGACTALIFGGSWAPATSPQPAPARDAPPWRRALDAAGATLRTSLVVSLGTAPLLAHHGLPFGVFAPVVNVLAIPWTGLLVLPTSLLAASLADWLPLGLLSALMLPAWILETAVSWAAGWLPAPSLPGLLPVAGLLLLGFLGLAWTRRGEWKKAGLLWIGIAVAGAAPGLPGRLTASPPRVVFFDVGQGDAAVVQGRSAVLLIDAGPGPPDGSGGATLVRGLRAIGTSSIDVLAVTHADLDHRAGAGRVLASFPVKELWLPISGAGDGPLIELSRIARERGTRVRWLAAGAPETARGDLEIDVLWPPLSSRDGARSRNETSMVLRVVVDELALLFTADIGGAAESALTKGPGQDLSARILKVAHHGSRESSSRGFLEAVEPEIAIVSAPCDPTRGLPNRATLDRLQQVGAELWWTGRDGAIIAARDRSGRVSMQRWGPSRECKAD